MSQMPEPLSPRPGQPAPVAIEEITALFASEGGAGYLGEAVTQAQHMCQAAYLAEMDGADDALVAASLLHDVGHFTGALSGAELMKGTDNHHAAVGARWLARWFGAAVTEPVRLHVAAKRYLCAVEEEYFAKLSPASVFTLSVQGGPMDDAEVAEFESSSYARQAVALRRWDDLAKDPARVVPDLEHFRPLLERLLDESETST